MPPLCDFCGSFLRHVFYDFGVDPETGYHDSGERIECPNCGFREDVYDDQN